MGYEVRLERRESRPLAVVRRRASVQELARVVQEACGLVWRVVREERIEGVGRHVAIYRDGKINLEVGVELEAPFEGKGEVVGSSIPGGTVATTTNLGPYNRLFEAHRAVREWCADRGHELTGPNWEIYGHWRDEWNSAPAEIRTDVFYLIRTDGASTGSA